MKSQQDASNIKEKVIYKSTENKQAKASFTLDFIKLNNSLTKFRSLPQWMQEVSQ